MALILAGLPLGLWPLCIWFLHMGLLRASVRSLVTSHSQERLALLRAEMRSSSPPPSPPIPHMHASVCITGLARKWTALPGLKKKGLALNLLSF